MPRKKKPVKILTLDTETIGLDGALKRIAIYDGIDVTYGYTFQEIESHIIDYYNSGYAVFIYIHNLEFDLRKLDNFLVKGKILWSRCRMINNRFVKVVTKEYTMLDSFRLLPMALSTLSKSFDLEHGKLDLWDEVQKVYPGDYENHVDFLNRCDKDNPLYLKYLGYDVISLYELIQKICEVAGITESEIVNILTTASLSRYIFKNGYKGKIFKHDGQKKIDFEILVQNRSWSSEKYLKGSRYKITYADIENYIRKAYHGGRTEVFKPYTDFTGEILARHYDVNSEYPAVMANQYNKSGVNIGKFFPVGFPEYAQGDYDTRFIYDRWKKDREGLGFIEVTVYIPKQDIPPLPINIKKLVFPTGYIRGIFTYPELEYAEKNCHVKIRAYHSIVHFNKTFPVFENFIGTFAKIKEESKANGEKALTQFSKLIQNTGYGWTGMRRDDKSELQEIEKKEDYDEERILYENEELGYMEIQSIVHSENIQVQIASYVTSYARIILLDALLTQSKIGHVYYCDTDSIVCEKQMPPELVHPTKLGYWDLEKEVKEGIFLQPKVYAEDGSIKFKGISKERQKQLDNEFYRDILERLKDGADYKYMVEENIERLRSIKTSMKKNVDANELEILDKQLNLDNKQKRQMFYNDNYTLPWHFKSLQEFYDFNFDVDYEPYLSEDGTLMDFAERSINK